MCAEPHRDGASTFTLAVASGKGGTGKTLVATNVATLALSHGARVVLADCDVEAPNDHLFVHRAEEAIEPVEVLVAEVDAERCNGCGECRTACAYGAIRMLGKSAVAFDELCHGCGLCVDVCSHGAIREVPRRVGEVVVGSALGDRLTLVTGRLDVGQVKAPAVIRATRARAEDLEADLVLLDAPPGVACSAVAAIRGADALLLVAESTPFGLHDLELSLRLGKDLRLPMAVIVNRATESPGPIDGLCATRGVPILARIPFDRHVAEIYARGALVADEIPEIAQVLAELPAMMRDVVSAKAAFR